MCKGIHLILQVMHQIQPSLMAAWPAIHNMRCILEQTSKGVTIKLFGEGVDGGD